jgi:hypothetical protein
VQILLDVMVPLGVMLTGIGMLKLDERWRQHRDPHRLWPRGCPDHHHVVVTGSDHHQPPFDWKQADDWAATGKLSLHERR